MAITDLFFLVITASIAVSGVMFIWMAIKAYRNRPEPSFIHLALGFTFIVAANVSTAISAFTTGFQNSQTLLTVYNALVLVGFLFLIFSFVAPDEVLSRKVRND